MPRGGASSTRSSSRNQGGTFKGLLPVPPERELPQVALGPRRFPRHRQNLKMAALAEKEKEKEQEEQKSKKKREE